VDTLLHICCGPCATATVEYWRGQGADLQGLFFNPNIHPLLEFRRRLTGARDLAGAVTLTLREDLSYDPAAWFAEVGSRAEGRCRACIGQRLRRTAEVAAAAGLRAFTTSLAVSPWQDHDAIREEGARAGASCGVEFLYADLRPLFARSRTLARSMGLYRQKYCGCLLSEWERYREP
jgi:predicted adenine nucleotide alpha hydrolase (AANH) superfamily ATPase